MKDRKAIFAIIALILALLVFFIRFNISQTQENVLDRSYTNVEENKEKQVDLEIDYGDGKIASYSAVLGNSVYDVLQHVDEELSVKEYDFGIMIDKIGEFENTKERTWTYFVNGNVGKVAADRYELQDEDKVEWRYIEIEN